MLKYAFLLDLPDAVCSTRNEAVPRKYRKCTCEYQGLSTRRIARFRLGPSKGLGAESDRD